jgi:hypothetical protein
MGGQKCSNGMCVDNMPPPPDAGPPATDAA